MAKSLPLTENFYQKRKKTLATHHSIFEPQILFILGCAIADSAYPPERVSFPPGSFDMASGYRKTIKNKEVITNSDILNPVEEAGTI